MKFESDLVKQNELEDCEDEDIELLPQEFIFLIDRSGSMYFGQNAITMAKEALKIFIHSLPEGSKFNVCSFGTEFQFLFDS